MAHSFVAACAESNAITPVKTFETAVDWLNAGKPAVEIYKLLSSVKRFKEFLPRETPKFRVALEASGSAMQPTSVNEFKAPMPVSKMTGALGKRPTTGKASTLDNFF